VTAGLERWTIARRPALVGLAGISVLVGSFAVARAAQNVWAVDAHRNLAAASALVHGTFGSVPDYLYSPLAAALTVPASLIPTDVAVVAWLVLKLAVLGAGIAISTWGMDVPDRVLAGIAVVGFLPILYDLELGNVTVLVLATIALVAWSPDRIVAGIPLGLILATAPKPQLIPVLLWMVVANRRALAGVIVTAAAATLVGLALAGMAPYGEWIAALRAPAYLSGGEIINLALWSLPPVVAVPCALGSIVAFGFAARRGYWPGLLAAICLGLLLAPYTLIYGAGLLAVVAPAAVRASPRSALGLAISAPVLLVLAFPAWVGLALAFAVVTPAGAWPSGRSFVAPRAPVHARPAGRPSREGPRS
jgi:hypothetical protein